MRTVNYKPKDYETIFQELLLDGYLEQLLSTDEHFLDYIKNRDDIENSLVMIFSIFALEDSKEYKEMTSIYNSNDIEKAIGYDLDILGDKCATLRPQATKSSVTLTFSLEDTLDYDYNIPRNTIVSTSDGISYATVDDARIIRGEYDVDVGALAVMNGEGSRVEANTLTISSLPNNVSVTNIKGSSGSHEAYTDYEYRQLLRNWTYSHIRGTKEAYDEFFANYDGLDDYRLVPRWDGAGTLKVIVDPSDDWIINDIYTKLEEKTFLLIEDVLITGAVNRGVDIKCTVNVDIDNIVNYTDVDYGQIRELVEKAIEVYINGGYRRNGTYYKGLGIGSDVVPFQIGLFVAEEIPEIKSIDFKDTVRNIDNTLKADEFSIVTTNGDVKIQDEKIVSNYGANYKSDILYVNYPYMVESDNDGYTIKLKNYDSNGNEVELFHTTQKKFLLENIDTYGGWVELEAFKDKASISYVKFYENDSDNDDYNVHICIDDNEKASLHSVTVKIQGEEKAKC